ncbi:MAG: DNA repair protein RecN [Oscillospiraceae bacterium]|nr:DNA repair protein RecN [Oscillospiraceae bacterium]
MLKELNINNLAIIEQANISFGEHFNVFTGETGAGKSILINGINSVLGQRVTKDIVRTGCDKAEINALFTDISPSVADKLSEFGISAEDNELSLTREINADGKSTARINGRAVTVSVMREIGSLLVSIHGQHDNQILLDTDRHIDVLDGFGGLTDDLADYRRDFRALQDVSRELRRCTIEHNELSKRSEELREMIEEIGAAELRENEDEEIDRELDILRNSEMIADALGTALACLSSDEEDAADELIRKAQNEVNSITEYSPRYNTVSDRLDKLLIELSDIADEISYLSESVDLDGSRLRALTERQNVVESLKHRYGPTLDNVLRAYENAQNELEAIDDTSEKIEELTQHRADLLHTVSVKAKELSAKRSAAAELFSEKVQNELSFLNMPDVRIQAQITQGKLTEHGMDTVEFLIAANKGESLRPLSKIASGGELSRIMLALKNVVSDEAQTLVFDEIDTGVSGRAAQKIAIKLKEVASQKQVLCVTHLPQIAAAADTHMLIEKESDDTRTYTKVYPLGIEERKAELARIMVGEEITETALKNAEELLTFGTNGFV